MRKLSKLVIWILLGCFLTWLSTYAIGKIVVAFSLSYLLIRLRRSRSARTVVG